jgi:drug/metabolite transporter (DMT)-like permease
LALVAVCLAWGSTFIVVKEAVEDMSVVLFLTVRFAIAAVLLALIFGLRRPRPPFRPALRGGILAGLLLFSGYIVQTFGLRYTTAAKTGFITALYIPLVPIFGALVYRKAPALSEVFGVALAFTGTALMSISGDLLSIGPGELLVACCAVAYAFHILVLAHFSRKADVGWLAVTQISTGALLGLLIFWWAEPVQAHWTARVWVGLGVTSVLATAFAFSAQTWAQKYTTATRTALIFSLEPVFAWLTSYLVAGELLTGRGIVGAALILGGILVAELKPFARRLHPGLQVDE